MKTSKIEVVLTGFSVVLAAVFLLAAATGVFHLVGQIYWMYGSFLAVAIIGFYLAVSRQRTHRRQWPVLLLLGCWIAVVLSAVLTAWPVRINYLVSRTGLDAIAARVQAGQRISVPVSAGMLTIRAAELSPKGVVCLWTDLNPGGRIGFVQCSAAEANIKFNLWSLVRLTPNWQFIAED